MIVNSVQQMNASLAIQLSYDWLKKSKHPTTNIAFTEYLRLMPPDAEMCVDAPEEVVSGLEQCIWNGRFQIVKHQNKR